VRRRDPSRPPAEPDAAVGQVTMDEAGVVDALVVEVAQRYGVA
jgi:hypothetical protein